MDCYADTSRAKRAVWLMKCPSVVSRSFHSNNDNNNLPVAKVLHRPSSLQRQRLHSGEKFTMELTGTDLGNVPKFYSMDMSRDFVPMSVFSESQGKISVEGKIFNKFDMRPHYEAIDSDKQLCQERTKKYMTKTRQIQVIGTEKPIIPMPGITRAGEEEAGCESIRNEKNQKGPWRDGRDYV